MCADWWIDALLVPESSTLTIASCLQIIAAQEEMLRKERELEEARKKLAHIRQQQYKFLPTELREDQSWAFAHKHTHTHTHTPNNIKSDINSELICHRCWIVSHVGGSARRWWCMMMFRDASNLIPLIGSFPHSRLVFSFVIGCSPYTGLCFLFFCHLLLQIFFVFLF